MSFSELFLIFIVALLVFGPKQLPMFAEHLGQVLRLINRFKQQLEAFWQAQLREQQLKKNKQVAEKTDSFYQE